VAERLKRLPALDMLRGIAALSVVLFHFYTSSPLPEVLKLPAWADTVFRSGYLGVDVFFVLSGLVIAVTLPQNGITWAYIGRFAWRRSVRLDPPYWVTLAFASVIYSGLGNPPSAGSVVAHVVYLQDILGFGNIISPFWTLCYEIQFYLVLVVLVWLAQRYGRVVGWLLAVLPVLWSVAILASGQHGHGWFINLWYEFALGVATTAMLWRQLSFRVWVLFSFGILALSIPIRSASATTAAATAIMIGLAGRAGWLERVTGGPGLQWLGRISYSLYLVHIAGCEVARRGAAFAHNRWQGAFVIAIALAAVLALAELFHRLIERPSHSLSRTIRVYT
jgi:peptidoglycan/LPS O-acetylase OafA/YrhL